MSLSNEKRLTASNSGPEPLPLPPGASTPVVLPAVSAETVATVVTVVTVVIVATAVIVLLVAALPALHPVPAVATTLLARKTAVSATTTAATVPVAPRTVSARGSAM